MASLESRSLALYSLIDRDRMAADFLTGIFWSAMMSYRHDTVLRPFPPFFVDEQDPTGSYKNVRELISSFNGIPSLNTVSAKGASLNGKQIELLCWILNTKMFTLHHRSLSEFKELAIGTGESSLSKWNHSEKPQFIFELEYNDEQETKFQSIAHSHGVLFAYHGSSVENFHSILHNGLLNLFNKTSAFGEGTYLSTELSVSLNWSPSGAVWPRSLLPHVISCVAICEVVLHPTVLSRQQSGGEPTFTQKVPEKYFVVSNDDYVRVKYVLVFDKLGHVQKRQSWLMRHKFVLVIMLYVILLLVVSLVQSKTVRLFFSNRLY